MSKNDEKFTNKYITELLRSLAAAYLLKNENRFKIIAYEKAADTVERLTRELKDLWKENGLKNIPGIGPSISSSLSEYFEKGESKHFESILAGIPTSVFVLMRIPSIGPKKAIKLVKELKLMNPDTVVDDLKKEAEKGNIAGIESFGEKSQSDILAAINAYKQSDHKTDRMPLPYAFSLAEEVKDYLKELKEVKYVEALGSLRRMTPTIGDIDLAVMANESDAQKIIDHFVKFKRSIKTENAGENKAAIIASPNIRIDLRVQEENNFGSMLQYFTGNKTHNIKLREYALKKGLSLSEWGIKDMKTGNIKKFEKEEDFYKFIGFPHIPPEIREGTNELDLALKGKLPHLVELKDIKGDMHTHSSYDLKPSHDFGAHDFQEMAEKAKDLGYEYIGFTEHNPNTSNNTEDEIVEIMKKRKAHIESLKLAVPCFIGMETDIQPNGELALPLKAIEYLDYMVVSVHSSFSMGTEQMTKRVLKALSYPKVKVLGHPTGRLLGKRPGYELEWNKIFDYAAEHSIAIEINSWPERLDLPDTLVHQALQKGIQFMIDTDAHAKNQMDNMFYGVSVARRGWAEKSDIINTGSYSEVKKWIEK